jgi:hypothetical protein
MSRALKDAMVKATLTMLFVFGLLIGGQRPGVRRYLVKRSISNQISASASMARSRSE